MITNNGKEIIAKYMLGQVPSYATHIGLGCGTKPTFAGITSFDVTDKELSDNVATLTTEQNHDIYPGEEVTVAGVGDPFDGTYVITARPSATSLSYALVSASVASASATGSVSHNYLNKDIMDFEMIRIPISSRGFVNEGGVSKIALSAEMPTEYRYEITEVALWSAGVNSIVTNSDSRILSTFAEDEGWVLHNTETPGSTGPIPSYADPLDGGDLTGNINITDAIFGTYADNESLTTSLRKDRQEGSRFLNYTIFMRGNTANIDENFVVTSASAGVDSHIHFNGRNFNLSRNSPNDLIKLALSIVPKSANDSTIPYRTRVVVEFLASEELGSSSGYAKMNLEIKNTDLSTNNRYIVLTKALKDLDTSPDFSWNNVNLVKVSTCIFESELDEAPSDQHYVVIDAMRFENISTINPLYVMSGYSVVNTNNGYPIVKVENTSNYIEFRLALGVG